MKIHEIQNYVTQEWEHVKEELKEKKRLCEEAGSQLKAGKEMIDSIEKRIDVSYEAFSPLSDVHNTHKVEMEILKASQEELVRVKAELETKIQELEKKEVWLYDALFGEETLEKNSFKEEEICGITFLEEQEAERQRIARDLHDTTVQSLTALIHKIDFCSRILDVDIMRAKIELELANQAIRQSINGMRDVIYNLRPMTFDDIGFEDTLHRTVDRMQKGMDTEIQLIIKGEPHPIRQIIQLTILRLIQESITNCKKYAKAMHCTISMEYKEHELLLAIEDDGTGFDMEDSCCYMKEDNSGFGISMMKERVRLLKGDIQIDSQKQTGTRIEVRIPIEKMEE